MAFSEVLMAQTGGPTPGGGTNDPTAIPLDGGASLLLASGVAYGIKHLRDLVGKNKDIPVCCTTTTVLHENKSSLFL